MRSAGHFGVPPWVSLGGVPLVLARYGCYLVVTCSEERFHFDEPACVRESGREVIPSAGSMEPGIRREPGLLWHG